MTQSPNPQPGQRHVEDILMRDEYLRTGNVPMGLMVRKGLASLLLDPWRTWITYLSGPIGLKLRQRHWRRRLGGAGKGFLIDPQVDFIGPENIYLDDFCYLARNLQLVAPEGYIRIGKRCHVGGRILGHGGVEIGDYVGCAGLILSATDSHQGGYRMSGPMVPPDQRNIRRAKVTIGDDAFIGHYSMVMPGVTIGEGAVVAPHSLVVRNVKPWTVVAGSPARVIAHRQPVRFPRPYGEESGGGIDSFWPTHDNVRPLTKNYAAQCAVLHREGIDTGFLSSLGQPFMVQLYKAIGACQSGFGFVWVDSGGRVLGFIACAESTVRLYRQALGRRGVFMAMPLAKFVVHPRVIGRMIHTLRYPSQVGEELPAAEVLSISVSPAARGKGVGKALMEAAFAEFRRRGISSVKVAVGADNEIANAFYRRCKFTLALQRKHHGLPMNVYAIDLAGQE